MQTLDSPRDVVPVAAVDNFWNSKRTLWLSLAALFLLGLPLFFFRLGGWAFFDPDEGRYGQIPRAMLESGDYITPRLNGVGFFDKPPLLYWVIAFFYRVLGISEGSARLVPALAAFAAVFGTWMLGRRMFGPRAGLLSGVILSTCAVWPIMARVVLTDMLVSSLIFIAMAFWWLSRSEDDVKKRTGFNFVFWTVLALGVLAKGPIAVVLAGGSIVFYTVLTGEYDKLRRIGWFSGVAWLLLITAPWFVLVQQHNHEFNHAFWIEQHFGRFLGKLAEQDHNYGPWYFLVMIPLIFFPWTFFAPAALLAGWKKVWPGKGRIRTEKGHAALFLCCGVVFMTVFFSGSSSKLVTYILPVLPLMAVALGGYFDAFLTRNGLEWNRVLKTTVAVLVFALLIIGIATWPAGGKALIKSNASPSSAHVLAIAVVLWAVVLGGTALKFKLRGAISATALGLCVIFVLSTEAIRAVAEQTTTRDLIAAIAPGLGPNTLIVSQSFTQSLTFYSNRRVAMLGEPDELRASLPFIPPAEREHWFLKDDADLKRLALLKTPVYFVSRHSFGRATEFEKRLDGLGGDIGPIVSNARFMLMGNAAARRLTPPHADVEKFDHLIQNRVKTQK